MIIWKWELAIVQGLEFKQMDTSLVDYQWSEDTYSVCTSQKSSWPIAGMNVLLTRAKHNIVNQQW